ncbi:hypothetical protein AALO_G00115340 [Alosa alosa]|uniref:BAAT/Acyl-CoA thioester hydrolase C-terminal domain-containing protein n=1 Tax=Alosa alosa TaxID=278164 RepID=A0AAV6GQR1_9TELE|nr:hypothetical protein AALO_G00115340 [Alosa alosa]
MASFLSGIKAVVTINGCCANTVFPLKYKDTIIPALMGDLKKVTLTEQGLLDLSKAMSDPTANENLATVIPVECADCNFMFVASEDDMNWDSVFFAELAAQRLRDSGKENFEIVRYPKAGHFVDVPYMPFYPSGVHAAVGEVVTFGGEAKTNAHAQVNITPEFSFKVVSHERPEHVLAKETHQRRFMKEGVQRVVVTDGRIRGALFIPPGPGPFPGIVDLYTLGGGPSEPRAFEEGVRFLQKHPKALELELFQSPRVEISLSMASFLSSIKAVVTIK